MVLLEAIGLASKEVFDYNRDNYKFDQTQRLERDLQRVEMQIKRFDLFREDIQDLVALTVDKMDMYHVVGALFLGFTASIFCEGLVMGVQPNFFSGYYLLTISSSFTYLLLAVWLSMYASIAAHSFGVRIRTRYVRLPIPSLSQIASLTSKLADLEKQSLTSIMRVPFVQGAQKWEMPNRTDVAESADLPQSGKASQVSRGKAGAGHTTLPESTLGGEPDIGFGREDQLMKAAITLPGRHIQLFRSLQAKWQCYDGYARVSMSLGINKMIQNLNCFVIGASMINKCANSCGFAATVIFQSVAMGLMFLDIAGLSGWKITCVQLLGSAPMFLIVVMLAYANKGRGNDEPIDANSIAFKAAPAVFFCEVIWLEVWMWLAAPSKDQSSLPRRFRTVLFLDVFGDAHYDPTEAEHAVVLGEASTEDVQTRERRETHAAVVLLALETAQSALRRWEAIPQELLSQTQASNLRLQRQDYNLWREAYHGYRAKQFNRRNVPYDPDAIDSRALRAWDELTAIEKQQDEFAETVIGPVGRQAARPGGGETYYDLEKGRSMWELAPGQTALTLEEVTVLVKKVEIAMKSLLAIRDPAEKASSGRSSSNGSSALTDSDTDTSVRSAVLGSKNTKRRKKKRKGNERLPFKALRRLTRVLQMCWTYLGIHSILEDLSVLKFYIPIAGRRLLGMPDEVSNHVQISPIATQQFYRMDVKWPFGAFFRPTSLSCSLLLSDSELLIGSPFNHYSLPVTFGPHNSINWARKPEPLPLQGYPAGAMVVSSFPSTSDQLWIAILNDDGKALRLSRSGGEKKVKTQGINLQVSGKSLSTYSVLALPCFNVKHLLPTSKHDEVSDECLLLAGWDGFESPIAAVQLPANWSDSEEIFVEPRVDLPLEERPDALHLSFGALGPRLWIAFPFKRLEVWDLERFHRSKVVNMELPDELSQNPHISGSFKALALCEDIHENLFVSGLDASYQPQILTTYSR